MNHTAAVLAFTALAAACGPAAPSHPASHSERRTGRAVDPAPSTDASTAPSSSSPPPSSSSPPPANDPPPSSPPASDPTPSEPPAPEVPAWHVVVDREMPYFACTGGGADFQLVMTTTDAIGVLADNSNVDGSVSIDANDHPVFAVGSLLNGTASNEVFNEDMLLTFDVGAVSCTAIAYEMSDAFVADYDNGTIWDDFEPGLFTYTWTIHLDVYGQMSATSDMYMEDFGDDTYQSYPGVYFVDGGTIHAALIGDEHSISGTLDADHGIDDHGNFMSPSAS